MSSTMLQGKKIAIDGFNLGLEKGTGVATYARNLSHELHALGAQVSVVYGNKAGPAKDPLMREVAFFNGDASERNRVLEFFDFCHRALLGPLGQFAVEVPISGQVVVENFKSRLPYFDTLYNGNELFNRAEAAFRMWKRLSKLQLPERQDLCHWTYPLPLQVKGAANIYTLHDLVPLRLPYTTLDRKKTYLSMLKRICRTADHIVTVSDNSRNDLISILDVDPKRVTNTYQSVSIPEGLAAKPAEQVAREVAGATGLDYKQYFLFWGSIEPKKNIGRLIEAYLASGTDAPLVIVGAQAWKADDELRLLDDDRLSFFERNRRGLYKKKKIIRLSYAPFSLLVSLIRGARGALFPSLYEGFGLPVLEAMLLGTPVICSNTSSLPEVAGDAALCVDPYDTNALAGAIRMLDADEDLRHELCERGRQRALLFSSENHQARLAEVYRQVL